MSFEFYEDFWDMQKYFMDYGELIVDGSDPNNGTPNKAGKNVQSSNSSAYILGGKLKKIEQTLSEVY